MTFKELEEKGIPSWPDNDGGLWYWSPEGRTALVEEEEDDSKGTDRA